MIRGLVGVVPSHAVQVGRFYIVPNHRDGGALFECIQTPEPMDDGFRLKALFMTIGGKPNLGLYELPVNSPAVALDEVHVRVDPTSVSRSAFNATPEQGLFLVRDDEAIICAPTDSYYGWTAVNINTGRVVSGHLGTNWLSFTRWSLVMDDEEGDELTIATFGSLDIKQ